MTVSDSRLSTTAPSSSVATGIERSRSAGRTLRVHASRSCSSERSIGSAISSGASSLVSAAGGFERSGGWRRCRGGWSGALRKSDPRVQARLENLDPMRERLAREVGVGPGHLDERELERQSRVATLALVVHRDREQVDEAQHRRLGKLVRLLTQAVARVVGQRQRVGHVADVLDEKHMAEMLDEIRDQPAEILTLVGELLDREQRAGGVAVDDGVAEAEERRLLDRADELHHVLDGDLLAGRRAQLVEHRDPVAEGSAGTAGDHRERGVGRVDLLAVADASQRGDQLAQPRALEHERLAARAHREQHLRDVGGAEDEDEVGRGLLDELQQRVPGRIGELVRLVDDVDLVRPLGGLQQRPLADLAHVVDPALRGRVHLDHVERHPVRDRARDARIGIELRARPAGRVQRLREDARHRRLARSARPGEEVGLSHLPRPDRVPQRPHDRLLPDHILEGERPVGAIQSGHEVTIPSPGFSLHCGCRAWRC